MAGNYVSLTEGGVKKSILLFALPLLAASLIQQLYSTVDLIFVGQFLGTEASAAIGASDLLITCLVGFFTGMSVGTSVITAQLFGAKKEKSLGRLIYTMFLVSIVGGILLVVVAELFAGTFLQLMGTPQKIWNLADAYLRVYSLSIFSVVLYNLMSGIVRALGDSRSPMFFQLIGAVFHIGAEYIFVVFLHMGVEGPALATALSQTLAAALVIVYLIRLRESYALRFRKNSFDRQLMLRVFQVGLPSGMQSVAITLSNILIQAKINTLGVQSIAAFTVYFKVEMFIYSPVLALGQALVSFVGQNFGARKADRIRKGKRFVLLDGGIAIFLWSGLLLVCSGAVAGWFSRDPEVIALTQSIIQVTFPFYFLCVILEGLSANLRGYGYAFWPMAVVVICYCGFRLLFLKAFGGSVGGVRGVALVYPVSWLLAVVLMALLFFRYHRKREKAGEEC